MRIAAALLCLFALIAAPAMAAESTSKLSFSFDGRDRTYYLFLPDKMQPNMPLVVLLHGTGGNGAWMVQRWHDVAAKEGIILLAPDSLHLDAGWDIVKDGPDYIDAVTRKVVLAYPIDPHRLYLFGQSGGAVYGLNLAMLESEYFAAVAVHAGGWRVTSEYGLVDYAKRKIPISIYIGDKDEYFPMKAEETTIKIMKDNGFPAELNVLPGRVHSYLDVPADFHDTVWAFFKDKKLDALPKFAPYRYNAQPIR